jgi:hypothetical protein
VGKPSGPVSNGTTTDRLVPTQVGGLGCHRDRGRRRALVALRTDGRCARGGNGTGQLGDGTTVARSTPITPIRVSDVVQIAAGGFTTYARQRRLRDGVGPRRCRACGRCGHASTAMVAPFLSDIKSISSSPITRLR